MSEPTGEPEKFYKVIPKQEGGRLTHIVEGPGVYRQFSDSASLKKAIELAGHCEMCFANGVNYAYEKFSSAGLVVPGENKS